MQESGMLPLDDAPHLKPRKKKQLAKVAPVFHSQGEMKTGEEMFHPAFKSQNIMKRSSRNEASPSIQQPERSTSDSLPDSSRSGNDYRALRRKYLLLEEESFSLGRELTEIEAEVKSLEDEKLALLDQLVVLEGLIDPSDLQRQR